MRLLAVAFVLTLAGCSEGYRNTLLPTAEPGDFPPEYRIVVPPEYEVRSVDYDAALVGIASGDNTSTVVSGRGVVSVYAVHRPSGAEVVLVYDDVQARPTPSAVIWLDRDEEPGRRIGEGGSGGADGG